LTNSGFIFRSDSNTEDLQGFAGAGLFDSIILSENKALHNEYSKSELFNNEKFKSDLISNITKLSLEVEKIYNYPQDIEGCFAKGKYYIVQTRPQV
jgi:alpha-glucan,water dikinase